MLGWKCPYAQNNSDVLNLAYVQIHAFSCIFLVHLNQLEIERACRSTTLRSVSSLKQTTGNLNMIMEYKLTWETTHLKKENGKNKPKKKNFTPCELKTLLSQAEARKILYLALCLQNKY